MKKSNPFGLLIHFERKTRLEPPLRVGIFLASLYLHPHPLEEVFGVALCEPSFPIVQNEKRQPKAVFSILSGKRDSNSRPQPWQGCALPTELFPQH